MIVELADAPAYRPPPMTDVEAQRLARRMFEYGAAYRRGRACVVGVRRSRSSRKVDDIGVGATWEKAFDAALRNDGR